MASNRQPARSVAKSAAAPATKPKAEDKALRVIAKRDGFRRAGLVFGSDPVDTPLADLSEAQYQALTTEPMLVTYLVDLPSPDAQDASTAA